MPGNLKFPLDESRPANVHLDMSALQSMMGGLGGGSPGGAPGESISQTDILRTRPAANVHQTWVR